MNELTEDFEILIVAWLKSGDENATNLAHSLAKQARKAFSIQLVSNCAIEQAKIEATKRIKMVVEVALHEYTTALNNGRCDECGEPLAKGEKATCEDCLCPE